MTNAAWAAIEAERERTRKVKEAILAKHSQGATTVSIAPEQTGNLTDEQMRTFQTKVDLHKKHGLPPPTAPKSLTTKTKAKKLKVFVAPFGGSEPAGSAKPSGKSVMDDLPKMSTKTSELPAGVATVSPDVINIDDTGGVPEEFLRPRPLADVVPSESAVRDGINVVAPVDSKDSTLIGMAALLTNTYGNEWFQWEPETIRSTVEDHGLSLPFLDGLLAIALCMVSDTPWTDWTVTEKVIIAINERLPQFATREHVSPAEMAHAVAVMRGLRSVEWSPEVTSWMAAILHHHGLVWVSAPLDIAQHHLNKMNKDENFTQEVGEFWRSIDGDEGLSDLPFQETALGIQLSRLSAMKMYCQEMGSA